LVIGQDISAFDITSRQKKPSKSKNSQSFERTHIQDHGVHGYAFAAGEFAIHYVVHPDTARAIARLSNGTSIFVACKENIRIHPNKDHRRLDRYNNRFINR